MNPSPRKPGHAAAVVGIALAVLLAGYVGAYYAKVIDERGHGSPPMISRDPYYRGIWPTRFGFTYQQWHRFFQPIHRLDRQLRPHVWEPPVWKP